MTIKLSHVVCAFLIIFNKYLVSSSILQISILVMGIILIHFKDGWFVIGGGRNGIEYNVLLITVLLSLIFQKRQIFHRNKYLNI